MLARQSIFCNYRLLIFFSLFFRICSFTIRVPGFGAVELDLNYVCECDCGKPSMAVSHFEWNFCAWTLCLEWCNHQKDRCKTWRTSLECESGSKREKNKASMATSLEKKSFPLVSPCHHITLSWNDFENWTKKFGRFIRYSNFISVAKKKSADLLISPPS